MVFNSDGETLLYASNRDGETDIISLNVTSLEKIWLTKTPNPSEYSPQFRPNTEELSYITLSKDGIQDFRNLEITVKNGQLNKIETILEKENPLLAITIGLIENLIYALYYQQNR